ncbi:WD repeat-containing protein 90 [Nelusetta ayraudi]|uniref:WD repeat-containing protein 90 n=1 Tax=Nelusetta ayraudi TaxID=303726 RepID=UPI003F724102
MDGRAWQHPYVNIFKHVSVGEWKRSGKQGDVSTCMSKTLRCPVFHIKAPIPASSYIVIPKNINHSLGLTGRYFYLLFRPHPGKYFVVHLDVCSKEGRVVRISFSNMFKEFKSSPTWLQYPFQCGAEGDSASVSASKSGRRGLPDPAPFSVRWMCLMMDLQYTLSVYLSLCHSHLKGVKLCANMAVKNVFTSDLLHDPGLSFNEAKMMGLASSNGRGAMPRDMAFPVPKGCSWHDLYDYIRFAADRSKSLDSVHKGECKAECGSSQSPSQGSKALIQGVSSSKLLQRYKTPSVTNLPELGVISTEQKDNWYGPEDSQPQQDAARSSSSTLLSRPPSDIDDGGAHESEHYENSSAKYEVESDEELVCTSVPPPVHLPLSKEDKQKKLLPDPILRLRRIIGFGGATAKCALWTKSGDAVVYPCHAIVVSLKISSNQQRFFTGHTDKVSALAFDGNTTLLASAQTGNHCAVRVWNYTVGNCLAMFGIHAHSVTSLSFSHSGGTLCGVGKDSNRKTMVVVWNTQNVSRDGDVSVLAKVHTDVDVSTMKVACFDDTRMVSCGRNNIRLWRVRNGLLRSCSVDLGEYHSLDFTDVAFEEGDTSKHCDDRTLFASSRSGYILEIDYNKAVISNARRLTPAQQQQEEEEEDCSEKSIDKKGPAIAINSICVSSSFCCTGSEDGFLRLWPLDFSAVFLEAEHEGPVSLVSVSSDGLLVLGATSTGNLGFLDVRTRRYNTLMRSHTDTVRSFSVDGIRRHLTTASSDGTVRIWNMDSLHQLYDFESEEGPASVAFHPSEQIFTCGFNSGTVRVFDVATAKLLAEHEIHTGDVVGLAFSPDGEFMYSADSQGSLAFYNASEESHSLIRVVRNVVARGSERAPDALALSTDSSRLAFVGPTEYIVTIADSRTLDELLHVDVSILDAASPRLDSALKVCFAPAFTEYLLVATSANKIVWLSTKTGHLLREVSKVHSHHCLSLAVSDDSRFLLTAGHKTVKVWDYHMQPGIAAQMFIGHSQPIRQVAFTPDQLGVVSVGDAIFLWDFLAHPVESSVGCRSPAGRGSRSARQPEGPSQSGQGVVSLSNGMPRKSAPVPSSPPPDVHRLDSVDQGGSLLDPRPASSFLKVTELDSTSPLTASHIEPVELGRRKQTRPDCYRHFIPRFKTSTRDQVAVAPQPGTEGLKLRTVIGYNGNGRGNMVWSPDQGLFAYSCGCIIVVEYLQTGSQRHLQGHSEEISCLAITSDAQTVVSAAGGRHGSRSRICIWDLQNGKCRGTITYHKGAVQSLAFSRDGRLFLSVGDYSDPQVALWSCETFQLLSSVAVSGWVHDVAFSPSAAGQLAAVGSSGVHFCVIHAQGSDVALKAERAKAPAEVGDVEMTAVCYHSDSLLFSASSRGHVCAWHVNTRRCFMTWEADTGEIGVLLCRGNRLLTGSNTRWLRLWEMGAVRGVPPGDDACRASESEAKVVMDKAIMLDGATVSAAFDDTADMGIVGTVAGTLWCINWLDDSSIRLVSGHMTRVNDVAFSSDERHFATCSEDGSVRVWLVPSIELVVQFQVLNQGCSCVCWSPFSGEESACVAAGYSDGTLRIFRLASSDMEMKLQPHHVTISAIHYSAYGHVILSAGKDGVVAVSSLADGTITRVIEDHRGAAVTAIHCVNEQPFAAEGNEMWLAASADRRVSVWAADWLDDKCGLLDWLTFPAPACPEDDSLPPSLAVFSHADPSLIIYTGFGVEKEIYFYSLVKKQIIKKIALPHWASCLSLSSSSELIAVGSQERVLKIIKSTNGQFQNFLQHSDSLQMCHFSPSGKLLLSVAFNEIMLWEVRGL